MPRPHQVMCLCAGVQGTLPVLNEGVLRKAITAGLALGCDVARQSKFDRKQYFYPDLPKGYQISQYDVPICANGALDAVLPDGQIKRVGITRAHIEEDAGALSRSVSLPKITSMCFPEVSTQTVNLFTRAPPCWLTGGRTQSAIPAGVCVPSREACADSRAPAAGSVSTQAGHALQGFVSSLQHCRGVSHLCGRSSSAASPVV